MINAATRVNKVLLIILLSFYQKHRDSNMCIC
jgi:hypothetical protein